MNQDLYADITNQIVRELEAGTLPWVKPWQGAGGITRPLRHNGEPYRGINIILLWAAAAEKGFSSPRWYTFKQAQACHAHVRKGEKGSRVTVASTYTKEVDGEERTLPFMKWYTVFNADQIEGLPAEQPKQVNHPIEHADAFFRAIGADIRHGGGSAFYAPGPDFIQLPNFDSFRSPEAYYATLAHECTHWSRHETRLDRSFGQARFGDEGYAMEELVAELGAAFLCAELGLKPQLREDHAPYVASWIKVMKGDKRAIFTAASYASKAADYLNGLQQATLKEAA